MWELWGLLLIGNMFVPPPTMLERLGSATDAASSLMGLVLMLLLN
jgi:hypothetical protein